MLLSVKSYICLPIHPIIVHTGQGDMGELEGCLQGSINATRQGTNMADNIRKNHPHPSHNVSGCEGIDRGYPIHMCEWVTRHHRPQKSGKGFSQSQAHAVYRMARLPSRLGTRRDSSHKRYVLCHIIVPFAPCFNYLSFLLHPLQRMKSLSSFYIRKCAVPI